MPTLEPHHHRDMAESFGSDPERYDRARPTYPPVLVERIVAGCPGRDVLDVGVGTGIVARLLRAAGCRVLGVDADARMAEFARRTGIEVEVSPFEEWDPAGRTFDAVVAGQTWHWVDPAAGAAKAAGVLRPGGRLVVFWNAGSPPADLTDAVAAVYRRVMPDSLAARASTTPAAAPYATLCARAADGIRQAGSFGDAEQWRFDWKRTYTRHEWLDQVPTTGPHTQVPPEQLAELLTGIGAAVDAAGGSFTMRYTTVAVAAARTGRP